MRKKQTVLLCMIISTLAACAKPPEKTPARSDMSEQRKESETDTQTSELYQIFIQEEYAGCEGYAYAICDTDNDGRKELYLKRMDTQNQNIHIITEQGGGLCIKYQKEIPSELNRQKWTDTSLMTSQKGAKMMHSGIYAYEEENNTGIKYWYQNEAAFIENNGFGNEDPFFEYRIPGEKKRLVFYYDKESQKGCGIRYYKRDPSTFITAGKYGFVFRGIQNSTEEHVPADYQKPVSVDGTNGSEGIDDFKENTEYDNEGKLIHYDSAGILSFLDENAKESESVLWIDYEYYDNGNLKSRSYWHNGSVFGTSYMTWNSYFDETGRIVYEDIYLTHGSLDIYYIYSDNSDKPAYILKLDNCSGEWMPEFTGL